MDKESIDYLKQYADVTETMIQKIENHAARYGLEARICAWYRDWEDFCSEWCGSIGYTRTQARKLLHGGMGEFMSLPDGQGIIRFAM